MLHPVRCLLHKGFRRQGTVLFLSLFYLFFCRSNAVWPFETRALISLSQKQTRALKLKSENQEFRKSENQEVKIMLGAIFGDMVGSVYEFNNTKRVDFPLLSKWSHPTDDTMMTLAVARALMNTWRQKNSMRPPAMPWPWTISLMCTWDTSSAPANIILYRTISSWMKMKCRC